jgi:hypothetical protein
MAVGPNEQLAERRQGPGRHDVGLCRRYRFDASNDDPGRLFQPHAPASFSQERGLAGIDLDQGHIEIRAQGGQDQPGKSATAAQVDEAFGLGRNQGRELG